MRADFGKRLESLEARLQGLPPEEPEGPSLWRLLLLLVAVFEGRHDGSESLMMALARGFGVSYRDLEVMIREPDTDRLNAHYLPAVEKLLQRGGLTLDCSAEELGRFLDLAIAAVPPSSRWLLVRMGFADE